MKQVKRKLADDERATVAGEPGMVRRPCCAETS